MLLSLFLNDPVLFALNDILATFSLKRPVSMATEIALGNTSVIALTSICILRCCLKLANRVRNIARESSNTSTTELTPFLESATHRYCLIALINMSLVLNTGPAFCSIDSNNSRDRIFDLNSCDLKKKH